MTTTNLSNTVRFTIIQDDHAEAPEDDLVKITYNSRSRYTLGTHPVDEDEDSRIAKDVRDGKLIGIPVFAYVHSNATIRAAFENPFGCPWDSGRSGWAYMDKAAWLAEHSAKRLTPKLRKAAYTYIGGTVETYDRYLNGDVWGFQVEQLVGSEWKEVDSCWGFFGHEYAEQEARSAAKFWLTHEVAKTEDLVQAALAQAVTDLSA